MLDRRHRKIWKSVPAIISAGLLLGLWAWLEVQLLMRAEPQLSWGLRALALAALSLAWFARPQARALAAADERYLQVARASDDAVWDWNMQTGDVYYSPGWKALLGYADEELENRFSTWEGLVHPDDRHQTLHLVDRCVSGEQSRFSSEMRLRHRQGHWVSVLSRGRVLFDEQQRPNRMVGSLLDISSFKATEQSLRDSESRTKLILDTTPEAIILTNTEGRICQVSARVEETFGYTRDEMIGQAVEMLLPENLREAHVSMREAYLQNPRLMQFREQSGGRDLTGRRRSGELFPMELGIGPFEMNGKRYVVISLADVSRRHDAERALQKSQQRLRKEHSLLDAVIDAAASVIVLLDRQGNIVRVNRATEEVTGYAAAQLQGRPLWASLIPPQRCKMVEQLFDRPDPRDIPARGESELLLKDGSTRLFDWRYSVLQDEAGGLGYVVCQGSDITEARAAEKALAEYRHGLEQKVQQRTAVVAQQAGIIEQSHHAIVTMDMAGIVTSWNHGAETLFGVTEGQALGHHLAMIYTPEQRDFQHQEIVGPLESNGRHEVELRLWHAEQGAFEAHLSFSMLYDDLSEPIGAVLYAMDISDRKCAELALRVSEANLAKAQAIASLGSWTLDLQSGQMSWSEEAYRVFGRSRGELDTIRQLKAAIHPDDAEQVMRAWAAALKGSLFDIEHRVLVNGREKWIHAQGELQLDEDGEASWALGTVQDVTDIKVAEITTRQALVEAKRLAKLRTEFVANMSHEIRTPLNAVLGLARMGQRSAADEASGECFGRIDDAAQRLLQLVNDIFDFSKLESGQIKPESKPFRLRGLIETLAEALKSGALVRGLECRIEVDQDLPTWVEGDALRLEQILANLTSNALKFTERGSVGLSVSAKGQDLLLTVSDTGIGISEAQRGSLFQPFEQGDNSTTRRFGGAGLGMSVTASLVALMGGQISVQSQPGEGSCFRVQLPLKVVEEPVRAFAAAQTSAQALAGVRVLAAEDVEVNRLVLGDLLQAHGAQLVFAEDGQQALDLLQSHGPDSFDLVLMDVQMPVMDGLQATRQIVRLAPELPVIGVTAHAQAEERERGLAAGMRDYLAKPVDDERLLQAIVGVLPHRERTPLQAGLADEAAGTERQLDETSAVDWEGLNARFGGRAGFIDKLLRSVSETQADTPAALRAAQQGGDAERMRFLVHGIKGMAGNLHMPRLQKKARALEYALSHGEPEAISEGQRLAGMLEQALGEVADHLARSDAK